MTQIEYKGHYISCRKLRAEQKYKVTIMRIEPLKVITQFEVEGSLRRARTRGKDYVGF